MSITLFIAIAAPLIIAAWLLKGEGRSFTVFLLLGMAMCLLASYVGGFVTVLSGSDSMEAAVKYIPIVEEIMKALPVLFYFALFAPKKTGILPAAMAVGLGFAILENAGFMIGLQAGDFLFALLRGFSAGVMHTVCGAVLGFGLSLVYRERLLAIPVAFITVAIAATIHAIYNLFVVAEGPWAIIGYVLPFAVAAVLVVRSSDFAE